MNYDQKAQISKCQSIFLAAYIQSGKTFEEAKVQVVSAKRLAELVVYGTQVTPKSEQEELPTIQQDEVPLEAYVGTPFPDDPTGGEHNPMVNDDELPPF